MTYIIAEPCIDIKDKSCVDVCPVDCIHEADRILVIDPEECIDCGACEPECPVEAIFPEDALPDKWEPFVKINYAYGDGFDVVNKLTDENREAAVSCGRAHFPTSLLHCLICQPLELERERMNERHLALRHHDTGHVLLRGDPPLRARDAAPIEFT